MVQLLRTGANQIINLDQVTNATYRKRGKVIDEANEVYTPVLTVSFMKGPDLRLEGAGASEAWDVFTGASLIHRVDAAQLVHLTDHIGVLADEMSEVDRKLEILTATVRIIAHVVHDMLIRERSTLSQPAIAPKVADGSPFDSIMEHVTPQTPPPWQNDRPANGLASMFDQLATKTGLDSDDLATTMPMPRRETLPDEGIDWEQLTDGADLDALQKAAEDLRDGEMQSEADDTEFEGEDGDVDSEADDLFDCEDDEDEEVAEDKLDDDARPTSRLSPKDNRTSLAGLPALVAGMGTLAPTRYPVTRMRDDDDAKLIPYDGPPVDHWPPGIQPTHYRELATAGT